MEKMKDEEVDFVMDAEITLDEACDYFERKHHDC